MRLFGLELKRILKSQRTIILITSIILLSVVMAYFPISFESINHPNEDGTVMELDGLAAIEYKSDLYTTTSGEVTSEKVKKALETYQNCVKEYGPVEDEDFPLAVSVEEILPIRPLLKGLSEVFADPLTGIGAELMEINPEEIDQSYYEKCANHLKDVLKNEQGKHLAAQQQAIEKYEQVDKPFYLYAGMSRDAFDYIEFYILFLAILCVAIIAPVFATEYQTGGDSILRATKHGRVRLAVTKILASCAILVMTYLIGMTIHLFVLDMGFGWECLKTSLQMHYSIINLSNINIGQLQIILVGAGMLSVLATISWTLFLSAKCKDSLTVLLVSIVILLIPLFAYAAIGTNWISATLPSAGIGMQNNFLYQIINFNYLHIGKMSFWTPYVILTSAVIEIPVFLFFTIKSYCNHQVK